MAQAAEWEQLQAAQATTPAVHESDEEKRRRKRMEAHALKSAELTLLEGHEVLLAGELEQALANFEEADQYFAGSRPKLTKRMNQVRQQIEDKKASVRAAASLKAQEKAAETAKIKAAEDARLAEIEDARLAELAAEKATEEQLVRRQENAEAEEVQKVEQLRGEAKAREHAKSVRELEKLISKLVADKQTAASAEKYLEAAALQEQVAATELKIKGLVQAQFDALGIRMVTEAEFSPMLWRNSIQDTLKRALTGSSHDQAIIGYALGRGEGKQPNWTEAVKWYKLAAAKKYSNAMYVLGLCHSKGRGVPQDRERAFEYFRRSAERKDVNGMFQAAWCYYNAKGVQKDVQTALKWCKLAARSGHANAVKMLGMIKAELGEDIPELQAAKALLRNNEWRLGPGLDQGGSSASVAIPIAAL